MNFSLFLTASLFTSDINGLMYTIIHKIRGDLIKSYHKLYIQKALQYEAELGPPHKLMRQLQVQNVAD